jgi:UDP-glucose 4-epimerase
VRVVDAPRPRARRRSAEPEGLEHPERVEVLIADLGDPGVAEVVADADVVFNVAGQVSHLASMTEPLRDLDLNVRSQLAFLETLRRARPQVRVVLTSTRQVYGRPERLPVDETHAPHPVDVNGSKAGRRAAPPAVRPRTGCRDGAAAHQRLRRTAVPRPRDLGVLAVFLRRALEGEVIEPTGTACSGCDCVHVEDVVRALALGDDRCGGRRGRQPRAPTSSTLREIAETIVWLAGSCGRAAAGPVARGSGPHRHR